VVGEAIGFVVGRGGGRFEVSRHMTHLSAVVQCRQWVRVSVPSGMCDLFISQNLGLWSRLFPLLTKRELSGFEFGFVLHSFMYVNITKTTHKEIPCEGRKKNSRHFVEKQTTNFFLFKIHRHSLPQKNNFALNSTKKR